ncbi:MAG: hypothetical protein HY537_14065 [Deltaproteobacteria bacterium]|nr:hypothetical protein [Deltaproteobacteria bacterium]
MSLKVGIIDKLLLVVSTGVFVWLFYLLFFQTHQAQKGEAQIIGTLQSETGVKRRHSGSLSWGEIKGEAPVYLRDIIYTPKNSTGKVTFNNRRTLELASDSMIQFDEVTTDSVEVSLIGGELKETGPEKDVRIAKREPLKILPILTRRAKQLAYLRDPEYLTKHLNSLKERIDQSVYKKPKLETLATQFQSTSGLDKLDYFELQIVQPRTNAMFSSSEKWIELLWTPIPVDGVRYELQVARDKTFKRMLVHKTVKHQLLLQFEDLGDYHLRVLAHKGKEHITSPPSAIVLVPGGGRDVAIWKRLPAAPLRGYTVEVSKQKSFSRILSNQVVNEPVCPKEGLRPGRYYCRVAAIERPKDVRVYLFSVE